MPTIVLSNFNLVCTLLGGFIIVFGLVSHLVRERAYISEALPSLLFGVLFKAAGLFRPDGYGATKEEITREFTRLVLGIQLVLAGVQLPAKYLQLEWKSLFMLLVPVMSTMWIASALIIYLCIPNLRFLDALIIGACVTPTDPVLSNSIVKGRFAEKYIAEPLRNIISAESGANDGFGYPFLFLGLFILRDTGPTIAKDWILETILYEIALSVIYGAVVGYVAMRTLHFVKERSIPHFLLCCTSWNAPEAVPTKILNLIDDESFAVFVFALALFIVGTAGMVGTDDLLACFVAGNMLTWEYVLWIDWFRVETIEDSLPSSLDLILNVAMFTWFGIVTPWEEFNTHEIPVWRYIVMGLAILAFRRLPAVLLMYKAIPTIATFREAIFAGYFGPIGVGAIFYLLVLLETLATYTQTERVLYIAQTAPPVIYFLMVTSVVAHGVSIPAIVVGPKLPRTLSRSLTQFGTLSVRKFSTFSTAVSVEHDPVARIARRNVVAGPSNAGGSSDGDELEDIVVVDVLNYGTTKGKAGPNGPTGPTGAVNGHSQVDIGQEIQF
ncbi:Sodium/hydrogen exchanger family-domain-containing protein [Lipomyces tetrasporus]|uniref:Sodium/hydrogen exchanger family-domain-containing protein n=1 Tax=Lipomyces tetrasporus TaxID=54092 RepID=A0AAD7QZD1_9ASCO|nr:Sodium/hydrogen exchanger family-domain-containing protein [Lipomyces tetrasporus]KAJ8104204.1 Sodium/hydrogen exchanger family-domain-containing protein [Lipomyces tetrasporus]